MIGECGPRMLEKKQEIVSRFTFCVCLFVVVVWCFGLLSLLDLTELTRSPSSHIVYSGLYE